MKPNFAKKIEKLAGGSIKIIGIVVGHYDGFEDDHPKDAPPIPKDKKGVVMSWGEARPYLDYEWPEGFGSVECHAITAWTKNAVIFVSQYDGWPALNSIPRFLTAHMPEMPGG